MTSTITRRVPPQRVINLINPVVRALLHSPVHGAFDNAMIELHVVGRRTGRHYDIPVGYLPLDGGLVVATQHRWRANLRGTSEVEVTHDGHRQPMGVHLDEDPASAAATFQRLFDRHGPKVAGRTLGLDVEGGGAPSLSELEAAVREYDLAAVVLTPTAGSTPTA
jgi:hypothetical protein